MFKYILIFIKVNFFYYKWRIIFYVIIYIRKLIASIMPYF